ncbi:hypothetical protein NPIL_185651, partial [Nephila pilipes]
IFFCFLLLVYKRFLNKSAPEERGTYVPSNGLSPVRRS